MVAPRSAPRLSVVVPVWNGGPAFVRCLRSLREQEHDAYEIIVADDGSTDGSAELAEAWADRVVRLARKGGPGRARNAGAALARGSVLVFTDADCVIPPGWLSGLEAALVAPAVGAVASGYAWSATDDFVARFNFRELAWRRRGWRGSIPTAPSANLAVRRDLFEAVGGFPTDLDYASTEDLVLTWALSRRAELRWVPDLGIGHHFRGEPAAYLRQQFNYARPTVGVYLRFPGLITEGSHHPRRGWLAFASAPLLLAAPVPLVGPLLAGAGLALALGPEVRFLRSLLAQEGAGFALRAAPLLVARNVAWFLGAVSGARER